MSCKDIERQLSPALDGELEPAQRAAVEAHVASCSACGRRWRALRMLRGFIEELPLEPLPKSFDVRMRARGRRWSHLLPLAAALLVALGLWWARPAPERGAPESRQTEAPAVAVTPTPEPPAPIAQPKVERRGLVPPPKRAIEPAPEERVDVAEAPPEGNPFSPPPVVIDVGRPGVEKWRGGRSVDLEAFEERLAADARTRVTQAWREP